MICAAHLAMQAEDSEINLSIVPAAITVYDGQALCISCFWMVVDRVLPKADDQ